MGAIAAAAAAAAEAVGGGPDGPAAEAARRAAEAGAAAAHAGFGALGGLAEQTAALRELVTLPLKARLSTSYTRMRTSVTCVICSIMDFRRQASSVDMRSQLLCGSWSCCRSVLGPLHQSLARREC